MTDLVQHERVGKAGAGPQAHVANDYRSSVAVAVERVGTACTLSDSKPRWFWIMSKPAAVVGSVSAALQSNDPPPSYHSAWTAAAGDGGVSVGSPCAALVRWHVWHERTYLATSQTLPIQELRHCTIDLVLVRSDQSTPRALWVHKTVQGQSLTFLY